MRLLICAGGTGGGVYPALTVLQALKNDANPVLWVGGEGGMEADLVTRAGIPFTTIPAAGIHGVGPRALPGNIGRLWRGYLASRRILKQFRPDLLFFTGGYLAAPMALAGRGIPSLTYVPDIEPGLALKFLFNFSSCVALTAQSSRQYIPPGRRAEVTGYPVRADFRNWDRAAARAHMGLSEILPVLLVFGGSKGARTINYAMMKILPELLKSVQVIHITGKLDWSDIQRFQNTLPASLLTRYHASPYLHEDMGAALASADLAISRAGASSLGEYPILGLPAILIPYPFAWRYQKVNADYLARNGAAFVIEDAQMNSELLPAIQQLIASPNRLAAMKSSMLSLAQPDAANHIARLALELSAKRGVSHD